MPRRAAPRLRSAPGVPRFVSYIRVSTGKQAIGPEAQRDDVARHIAAAGGVLVAEFAEIETGTNKRRRPQMAAALAECRLRRATLVIAKLDRLARNVHFVSGLMESGVAFVACDNPYATPLTIHILAAVAEDEAKRIAQRTKDALAVVRRALATDGRWVSRRSGKVITRLGNPRLRPGSARLAYFARQARTKLANAYAADVMEYIDAARKAGCSTNGEIARALTARGIETPGGGREWSRAQVARVQRRDTSSISTERGADRVSAG
jgi:DNA invertase Pin-like site-specific DNA recombinase